MPGRDRRGRAVELVERGDRQRHRDHRQHRDRDLQRRRERAVPPRGERAAQRHGCARRDRHQHDTDLRGTGQLERAGDDQRKYWHCDQYREQGLRHQAWPLPDPAEFARHERQTDVEHDDEYRRGDRGGQEPFRHRRS
jgi:hypothetical protein